MPEGKIHTITEPVEPWQPIGCIACPKPAVEQETAYLGDERLSIHIRNCGDPRCKEYAIAEAMGIAENPKVQELALAAVQ